MTPEDYDKAYLIDQQKSDVKREIKIWEQLKRPSDLGYKQHWNKDHLVALPCEHIPVSAFEAYKTACLSSLKLKLVELDKEFSEI